jgi:hypothetical protein
MKLSANFHEEIIPLEVVNEVIEVIENNKKSFIDVSLETCTNNGFQSQNIMNIFSYGTFKKNRFHLIFVS